jgi:TRAP transporter TAXI family solute receptor
MGVGLQAWKGDAEWTKQQQHRSIRALFPMYDTTFQFVVLRKSKIRTLAEMQGARVGVGPRAGTGGTYVPAMFKTLNVHAEIGNGSFADIATELVGGRFDAVILAGGAPFPAFRETESKEPLQFISLLPAEIQAVRTAMPELSLSRIPAGTYASLTADYETVGVYNFAIANANLPRTLAYAIVKTVHENQSELVKRHSAATETLPVNVEKNTFLPFHPGAVDYYREIGINVPKDLVPSG